MRCSYFERLGSPRIAYSIKGAGPLVIFLHGVGGNRLNWSRQLDVFANDFTAVAWDARGYGDSADEPPLINFSDFAEDLAALIKFLDVGPAHLVGLSMGGMIALSLFERYPELVGSLVLADTSAGFGSVTDRERDEFLRNRLRPLEDGMSLGDIAEGMLDLLVSPNSSAIARMEVLDSLKRLRELPYRRALEAIVTTDFSEVLNVVTAPTLVIVGEQDIVTPVEKSQKLVEGLPNAELYIIGNCGHLSNIEQPRLFSRKVFGFIKSVTG